MKRLILTIILAVFCLPFINCTPTAEQTAKKAVKAHLMAVLNDPASYEAVEWGTLDSIIVKWDDYAAEYVTTKEAYEILKKAQQDLIEDWKKLAKQLRTDYSVQILDCQVKIMEYIGKIKECDEILSQEASWEEFKGYRISHKFRASNAFGVPTLHNYEFKLDTLLSAIQEINDLTE